MRTKGTIGLALVGFRVWRRLTPGQRALVLTQVRKHGPRAATALTAYLRTRSRPRRRPPRGRS